MLSPSAGASDADPLDATPGREATLRLLVGALGATGAVLYGDLNSPSAYARSKAQAEQEIRAVHPDAVVLRPSLVFGAGDGFLNRFASMATFSPHSLAVRAAMRIRSWSWTM